MPQQIVVVEHLGRPHTHTHTHYSSQDTCSCTTDDLTISPLDQSYLEGHGASH